MHACPPASTRWCTCDVVGWLSTTARRYCGAGFSAGDYFEHALPHPGAAPLATRRRGRGRNGQGKAPAFASGRWAECHSLQHIVTCAVSRFILPCYAMHTGAETHCSCTVHACTAAVDVGTGRLDPDVAVDHVRRFNGACRGPLARRARRTRRRCRGRSLPR